MQSCSNCENEYDAVRHIPRILISCGHTYCQVCIQLVIKDEMEAQQLAQQLQNQQSIGNKAGTKQGFGSQAKKGSAKRNEGSATPQAIVFECFECGIPCQIDPKIGVNALPKNMVLIPARGMSMQGSDSLSTVMEGVSTTGTTKQTQGRTQTNSRPTITSQSIEHLGSATSKNQQLSVANEESSSIMLEDDLNQSVGVRDEQSGTTCCKLHPTKKIEAFCEKDFKLLCIDCILSDRHKNHEIISIAKASEKHQIFLQSQQEGSLNIAQKLISSKNEIQRHLQLMKLQAEQNRRELSLLYNAIRDMLIQREQALKTYISEVYQKEEDQCEAKVAQIDEALEAIEEYDDNIQDALSENDIDLLRRFNERKLLINTFNADSMLKELQQLNVSSFGLANGPPTTTSSQTKTKKMQAMDTVLDDQPPFQSLQEIRKEAEQLQVSKIIHPNFKGQITSCTGILPFNRSGEDSRGNSNLYQQHTAASSLKVNKRSNFTAQDKTGGLSNQTYTDRQNNDDQQSSTVPSSSRPFNQYRRTGTAVTQHMTNASPKPGENKRRQTQTAASSTIGVYSGAGSGAKTATGTRAQQQQLLQSRTHSYNQNVGGSQFGTSGTNTSQVQNSSKDGSNQINLFNQIKSSSAVGVKRANANTGVSQRVQSSKQVQQHSTMLQQVTTQRVSLQEDTSLDLKHIKYTGSDKNLLKASKQSSTTTAEQNTSVVTKGFPNLNSNSHNNSTSVQRKGRVNQDKQISNDLLKVQNQVNQVMSNLETFETKKRQLSAKKEQRAGGKMFTKSSPMQPVQEQQRNEYKAKLEKGTNQRPLTNAMHKRNNSGLYDQSNSLNNSDIKEARNRMTSPPGKQQLLASQQPRKPAADNVVGNESIDREQQNMTDDDGQQLGGAADISGPLNEEQLPVLHIKLDEQTYQAENVMGSLQTRKLSNPNMQLKLQDSGCYENGELSGSAVQVLNKQHSNEGQDKKTERQRIKSPIVRIDLNNDGACADVKDDDDDSEIAGDQDPVGGENEDHIANLPDMNNDSMVGDLNQLISDLNGKVSGNNKRVVRQTSAGRKQSSNQQVSESFDKQAKALYFDLGGSDAREQPNLTNQAKTMDYVEREYTASASRRSGSGRIQPNTAGQKERRDNSQVIKSANKQKYIEQSLKQAQIQQNILAVQGTSQALIQMRTSRDRSRDTSQPLSSARAHKVPDLNLDSVDQQQPFDLLKSDRSSQEPTNVPTAEATKLTPNDSSTNKVEDSLKAHNQNSSTEDSKNPSATHAGSLDQINHLTVTGPAANHILSASSSAYSMNQHSMSQASIDPFKALCQLRDEYIFVFSGFNERKLTHCEVFDAQRGIWKEIAPIQNPRTKFAAVPISKTRILIFGGKQADGQRTADIEEYNLKNNSFKTLPFKMPKARSGFAACIKRDEARIYFCGGNSGSGSNGSVLRKFDCLDLKKGKWTRLNDMLLKRDELSVAFGPDAAIYAIGGFGGGLMQPSEPTEGTNQQNPENEAQRDTEVTSNTQNSDQFCKCLKEAERYNFTSQQWEMLPPMNEARRALAAVVLPDGIYAIGGYDGRQYLATVEKFDLNKQEWVYVKSMNTARCTLSAVASSDCQYIYVLGGYNGKALNLVERYSVMSNTWELMPPMNVKRFMHQSVTLLRQEM